MIIGRGDIASVINDREGAVFFASGVSNSSETREKEFTREVELLLSQPKDRCIFYFSSISVDDESKNKTRYIQHKRRMENIIKKTFENYNIIRIGNITWGSNPNTFLNYIHNKIKNNEPVLIKDEYKFMITEQQLLLLTDNLPLNGQNTISAFGTMQKVKDLI